jgi:hypothetical protein
MAHSALERFETRLGDGCRNPRDASAVRKIKKRATESPAPHPTDRGIAANGRRRHASNVAAMFADAYKRQQTTPLGWEAEPQTLMISRRS